MTSCAIFNSLTRSLCEPIQFYTRLSYLNCFVITCTSAKCKPSTMFVRVQFSQGEASVWIQRLTKRMNLLKPTTKKRC